MCLDQNLHMVRVQSLATFLLYRDGKNKRLQSLLDTQDMRYRPSLTLSTPLPHKPPHTPVTQFIEGGHGLAATPGKGVSAQHRLGYIW